MSEGITKLLLVDDHAIVRHGLALLIAKEPGLKIAGEAAGVAEAREMVALVEPDIAVVDLTLKDGHGLDLVREWKETRPALKCLVLSMHDEKDHAERALRAGAMGYVMKEDADEVIVDALRTVMRGEVYASPEVSARLLRQMTGAQPTADDATGVGGLTEREREIFRCLGEGLTSRRIAEKFELSERTVEVHRSNIKRKLGCADAAQLLREAVRWVESGGV